MLRKSSSQEPADLITDLTAGDKKATKGLTEALIEDVMASEASAKRRGNRQGARKIQDVRNDQVDQTVSAGSAGNLGRSGVQDGFYLQNPSNLQRPTSNELSLDKTPPPAASPSWPQSNPGSMGEIYQQLQQAQQVQQANPLSSSSNPNFSTTVMQPMPQAMPIQQQNFGDPSTPTQSFPSSSLGGNSAPIQ